MFFLVTTFSVFFDFCQIFFPGLMSGRVKVCRKLKKIYNVKAKEKLSALKIKHGTHHGTHVQGVQFVVRQRKTRR